jgi:chemosensory pili system protein ChpA (sensor histidine kinase/response regulator)
MPMSLSITKAILVCAGEETFAIPMSAVRFIYRVPLESDINGQRVVGLDGQAYPLVHLADQLHLERTQQPADQPIPVLMVQSGDRHVALGVDRVVSCCDVIVKSLGNHLRRVPGLAGATLMGDGTVVPILEVGELLDTAGNLEQRRSKKFRRLTPDPLTVLLVDDSVSVRKVMSKLISGAGWSPIATKDGLDALETLEGMPQPPEIILLDIEMPRMDGFELLSTLRGQDRFRQIPIVMISSRTSEKHRQKAKELGATDYVVKPFQERALLALICELTGKAKETVLA